MDKHDGMSITQMWWQPPLLRLTYAPHPEVDGGNPTDCFIAPQLICGIQRQTLSFSFTAHDRKGDFHPIITVTAVALTSGLTYYVQEVPSQIAMLRDRALGHEKKLETIK